MVSKLEYVRIPAKRTPWLCGEGAHMSALGKVRIFAQTSRTGIKYTLVCRIPAQRVKWSLKLNRVPGLYLSDWASICQTGPLFVRLGLYLSGWASICQTGPLFVRLGLYLSDWASICQTGPLFVGLGLYLSDWASICQRGLLFGQNSTHVNGVDDHVTVTTVAHL